MHGTRLQVRERVEDAMLKRHSPAAMTVTKKKESSHKPTALFLADCQERERDQLSVCPECGALCHTDICDECGEDIVFAESSRGPLGFLQAGEEGNHTECLLAVCSHR